MKLKRIGLMEIVFTCTIWLTFYSGALSFARCPSSYPVDCGNGWCCETTDDCGIPELPGASNTYLWTIICRKQVPCPSEEIYGEHSEETELLRNFRDNILSQTPAGQEIIKLYYELSPAIVQAMEKDEEFKEGVKELIDGLLLLIREEE